MSYRNKLRPLLGSVAALGLFAGPWISSASAVSYTLAPSVTGDPLDWNTDGNWTPSGVPGGTVASDTANLSVDFGGFAQTVNVSSTLTTALTGLTLGDTNATPAATTIGGTGGSLMFAAGSFIHSSGTPGAVNTISAPILHTGNLIFATSASPSGAPGATNGLTVTGKIGPSGTAASRVIENSSVKPVTLGDIDISSGSTTGVTLTIRSGTTGAWSAGSHLNLNGTIADGGTAAGNLTLGARSGTLAVPTHIQISGTNTYTGNTSLGIQANAFTTFKINSDQPFGAANTGNLVIGNASGSTAIFEAVGSDRVIAKNTTTINRNIAFQGDNSLTLASNTLTTSNNFSITNNITAPGKTVTLGSSGGTMYLNNNNSDLLRTRDFAGAGTTVLASNIVENSGAAPTTASRMGLKNSGTGTLVITGDANHQGGIRLTGAGTVQIGDGSTSGSYASANGVVPVVSGTAGGTLAYNRSDDVASSVIATGSINLTQKGSGSVTLANNQFHWGGTTVGDGSSASKLVVGGSLVAQSSTTANATIGATTTYRTVTLGGSDTIASLGIQVGQPVWVTGGSASAASYVDSITGPNTFTVWGETLLTATPSALTFGEGSALGSSASVTTVNNLATLAGAGVIAGSVNALAGSHLSPGATDGVAGTLTTGSLTLNGATLDFDLAATAAGVSDFISVGAAGLSFADLTFSFNAITAGVLEAGAAYDLVSGAGVFAGDVGDISTIFDASVDGLFATYALVDEGGVNHLRVVFAAIPEPASFGLLLGVAALGGCAGRRRRARA